MTVDSFPSQAAKKRALEALSKEYSNSVRRPISDVLLSLEERGDDFDSLYYDLPYDLYQASEKRMSPYKMLFPAEYALSQELRNSREEIKAVPVIKPEPKKKQKPSGKNAATHNGNCQCCGRLQAVTPNGIAKHGYTKDFGFFNGICMGSDRPPLQYDRKVADSFVIQMKEYAEDLIEQIGDLSSYEDFKERQQASAKFYQARAIIRDAETLSNLADNLYGTELIERY